MALLRGVGALGAGLVGGWLTVPCALLALWAWDESRLLAAGGWTAAGLACLGVSLLVAQWLVRTAFLAALAAYAVGAAGAIVLLGIFA